MANEPAAKTAYVVLKYKRPHWHTVLATTDNAEAEAMLKTLGKSGRIEEFKPRKKRR